MSDGEGHSEGKAANYNLVYQELLASFERSDTRIWAAYAGDLSPPQIEDMVEGILRQQLIAEPGVIARNSKFIELLTAVETVFDPVPPDEATLEDAWKDGLEDYWVFQALRGLTLMGFHRQSPTLQKFQMFFVAGMIVEPKAPGGPKASRDLHRNMVIVSQIEQMQKLGIAPTRSVATQDENSACDIVARAMVACGKAMSYSAVEAVWKKRDKRKPLEVLAGLLIAEIQASLDQMSSSEK